MKITKFSKDEENRYLENVLKYNESLKLEKANEKIREKEYVAKETRRWFAEEHFGDWRVSVAYVVLILLGLLILLWIISYKPPEYMS